MKIVVGITKNDLGIEPDEDMWSAYCDKLDLSSFGETEAEAKQNISSTIALYVKSLVEKGILLEVMKERGIEIRIIPEIDDAPCNQTISKTESQKELILASAG